MALYKQWFGAFHLFLFLTLSFIFPSAGRPFQPSTHNIKISIGINLTSVSFWSTELVFVDIFKQSQPWKSQEKGKAYEQGPPLALSDKHWVKRLLPGQMADSIMLRVGGHYPSGRYVCLYDGRGELDFSLDARVIERSQGRLVIDVTPTKAGIALKIIKTDPRNPVRNIRVILPGFEKNYAKQPFHPDFLKRWKKFKVIRFMDWMRTNNSVIKTWHDRPTIDMQTQGADRGVALEYMLQLANTLYADPWFCIPHEADYDYVRNFAKMVKAKLNPELRVYVEYTNEAWNGQFEQAAYCARIGQGLDLDKEAFKAWLFFYAKRATEIFQTWEDVFGGTDRLVRVLGAQFANPWTSEKILMYEKAYKHADALAVAPYFGYKLGSPEMVEKVNRMTEAQILIACEQDIEKNFELIVRHKKETDQFGLRLIAYEGGQHLAGFRGVENNLTVTDLFHAVNRHSEMKELYLKHLAGWQKAGGDLYVAFASMSAYNKWGSWGLLENIDQSIDTAPKYQAITEVIEY
ncbi:hypothetical protein QUF90_20240 [Desulfococcaceae bacterium HSG9]|nr:hypothetical protein [Desulfococcaceae bacterium HSG9]